MKEGREAWREGVREESGNQGGMEDRRTGVRDGGRNGWMDRGHGWKVGWMGGRTEYQGNDVAKVRWMDSLMLVLSKFCFHEIYLVQNYQTLKNGT